jgi:rubredoxin
MDHTLWDMPSERTCPDCDEPLEQMELQGTDVVGDISIVSQEPEEGFLSSLRADEILTPVPYVCPECRRILFYGDG